MRKWHGKIAVVGIGVAVGFISALDLSAEQVCMFGGNATPVTTNLTCAQQCDARDYCRYLDGGTTYDYTECSPNSAEGPENLCEKQSKMVSNLLPCVKDTAAPCVGNPMPQGCIDGACASGSNIFQCRYKEDAVPVISYADKWVPIDKSCPNE